MCIGDILEIYDFIEKEKVNDIYDLVNIAVSAPEIKLNWLDCLSDDRIVDLFTCKIMQKNHRNNMNLIKRYYEQYIGNSV